MKLIQYKYVLFYFLQFLAFTSFTQTNIHFLDSRGESITGVKVSISSTEGKLLLQAITDAKGIIEINASSSTNPVHLRTRLFGFSPIDTLLQLQPDIAIYLQDDILKKREVVVTAQYGAQQAENSIHKINIIDREKIEAMGAVNLRDVLSNQLGVRISQDNVLGSGMTLQGISGENVKILIDGVPVVGRLNGNIDLSQINLQNIDHIEIVEGPLSVNYGTNALAGVINLISQKPSFNQINGTVSSYYESIGHYNLNTEINYGSKFSSFGINAGRNFFDGWRSDHSTFQNPTPITDSSRFMTWKPKEQLFAGAYYQWNKKGWFLRYKVDYFNEFILNRGYPRKPYLETAFDDEYTTERMDHAFSLKKKIAKHGLFKSLFSYNRYDRLKNTYFVDLTTLNRTISADASAQDTSAFDQWVFRGSYASSKDSSQLNYQLGYDVLLESAEGKRILSGRQEQGDFALFGTVDYRPWKSIAILAGLRYAYNTTYSAPLLPSVNVKWKLAKNWNLRASYARGFRAPSIKELYFEFIDINHNIVGNESLLAESSHNLLGSLLYKRKKKKYVFSGELNGFYNTISNRISLSSIEATQFSYVNIGSFQSTGARFTANVSNDRLNASVGFNWIGSASNSISSVGDQFLFYPEVQSSVIYSLKKRKTSFALFYKYQGQLPNFYFDENGNVAQGITQDYQLLDITITQPIWKDHFTITVGSKNILNVTQINTVGSSGTHSTSINSVSVGTGRTYFASLKFHLQKSIKRQNK